MSASSDPTADGGISASAPAIAARRRARDERVREIAAGPLDDRAQRVGRAAQAAGDRIGVVDGDEQPVHVVHRGEQHLGPLELVGAQAVEDVAAQLARGFGQPVEVRGRLDAEVRRRRERVTAHEGERDARLGVLLLGVVQVPAVAHVEMRGDGLVGRGRGAQHASAASSSARSNSPAAWPGSTRPRTGSSGATRPSVTSRARCFSSRTPRNASPDARDLLGPVHGRCVYEETLLRRSTSDGAAAGPGR